MIDDAIEATNLTKAFGHVSVLRGIDLRVPKGSVFALLGPNGAGKTTTVRILATLTKLDGGSAKVAGFDVTRDQHRVRRAISLTGQYAAVDDLQTGLENLVMMGRLSGLTRAKARARATALLAQFDLTDAAGRRVATYSGGMRRRLDLAASMVVRPEVLFLDEPTTGLDPRSRLDSWQAVAGLAHEGVTVFLTTQYLEEADRLADRVAIVDSGRIVAEGTPDDLKRRLGGQRLDLTFVDDAAYTAAAADLGDRARHRDPAQRLLGVAFTGAAAEARALLDQLDPGSDRVQGFSVHSATLDDVFLQLTGHAAVTDPEPAHV
jgi:ABC-2 type transport system ATP-binding protein